MPEELLTIEQVAERLQLHPDTIRRYIREKKLPSVRISGTVVRIKQSDLDKFIQKHYSDEPDES
ncbi:MAG: helix-turn-helix domain-containing protein [Ktedonobacteraceae bacterium]